MIILEQLWTTKLNSYFGLNISELNYAYTSESIYFENAFL